MRLIGRIFGTRVRFVAAEEMDSALDDPEVVLLDVRTAAELEETGTIPGALHIHLGELAQRIQEVPKDRSILTTWMIGPRAARAAAILEQAGCQVVGFSGLQHYTGPREFRDSLS